MRVGEKFNLVRLGFVGRGVLFEESGEESGVGFRIFAGEQGVSAGEGVGGAILRDAGFAGGGAGAGGELGVAAVSFESTFGCWHVLRMRDGIWERAFAAERGGGVSG